VGHSSLDQNSIIQTHWQTLLPEKDGKKTQQKQRNLIKESSKAF
jgi:hypothetical protein